MPPSRADLLARVKGCAGILALVTDRIDGDVMDAAAPTLKCVSNVAVGYDNIVVKDAKARGLLVTNTPGVLTETSADFAWALLMAAARSVPQGVDYARSGQWKTWGMTLLLGQDVFGATLGVAGFGRIGQAVARRAKGFGMKILYSQRGRNEAAERELGAEFVSKQELLTRSDFISLNMSMNESSRGYIGAAEYDLMKPTAVLVNTARGPVVDTQALYDAMKARKIFAAALDVTDPEPLPHTHPLYALDNVIIVPHLASASVETRQRMSDIACTNMIAALKGERPPNVVAELL
jgi:glyoxylate reductase